MKVNMTLLVMMMMMVMIVRTSQQTSNKYLLQQQGLQDYKTLGDPSLHFYHQSPKVENVQSTIHHLYQRPYNYVSYTRGGKSPTQYKYHYGTNQQYNNYQTTKQPTPYPSYPQPSPELYDKPTFLPQNPYQPNNYNNIFHQDQSYFQTENYPTPTPKYSPYQPNYFVPSHSTPSPVQSYSIKTQSPNYKAHQVHHATAVLKSDTISGVIHFYQTGGPTSPVTLSGNITGLSPGYHGFHIHQYGDQSAGCKSMKGHFNPHKVTHGAPEDSDRHMGDLGNILAGDDRVAVIHMVDSHITLVGHNNIIGRGLVVHAGVDDLGRGGDDGSLATGNAGGRLACATIGLSDDKTLV